MELPLLSHGMARGGEVFCFLVDAEDTLFSSFLFFASASWACSSHKLHGMVLVGIALSSGASSLGLVMGLVGGGAWDSGLGSMGAAFAVVGGGPSLNMS